ncbi:MAG: hypothetical protein K8I00_04310, partial [Candidatus Omnitrophica bacterium]|nr:hypothetical protein [Candidatus Omnitrophota bacterium]
DYIVAFGPYRALAQQKIAELTDRGAGYRQNHVVDRYWYDLTRPELFWHAFAEVKNYARDDETITIYQKTHP